MRISALEAQLANAEEELAIVQNERDRLKAASKQLQEEFLVSEMHCLSLTFRLVHQIRVGKCFSCCKRGSCSSLPRASSARNVAALPRQPASQHGGGGDYDHGNAEVVDLILHQGCEVAGERRCSQIRGYDCVAAPSRRGASINTRSAR